MDEKFFANKMMDIGDFMRTSQTSSAGTEDYLGGGATSSSTPKGKKTR